MKKIGNVLVGIWLFISFLFILGIQINYNDALNGEKVDQLEKIKHDLTLENRLLKAQLAHRSSLLYAEKRAQALGFKKSGRVGILK